MKRNLYLYRVTTCLAPCDEKMDEGLQDLYVLMLAGTVIFAEKYLEITKIIPIFATTI